MCAFKSSIKTLEPEFFDSFGFYVDKSFLSVAECEDLLTRYNQSSKRWATISKERVLDLNKRRVHCLKIMNESIVGERVEGLVDKLSAHFKEKLFKYDPISFLEYSTGCFYKVHTDYHSKEYASRKVSVVLFLNDPSVDYQGGELVFHSLLEGDLWNRCAFSIKASAGLLVAFPSYVKHEVSHVKAGLRCTAVTWFS